VRLSRLRGKEAREQLEREAIAQEAERLRNNRLREQEDEREREEAKRRKRQQAKRKREQASRFDTEPAWYPPKREEPKREREEAKRKQKILAVVERVIGERNSEPLQELEDDNILAEGLQSIHKDVRRFLEFCQCNGFPECATCGTPLLGPLVRVRRDRLEALDMEVVSRLDIGKFIYPDDTNPDYCWFDEGYYRRAVGKARIDIDCSIPEVAETGRAAKGYCRWCGKNRTVKGVPAGRVKPSREVIPAHVKQAVWNRDRGKCTECGSEENLEYDHIIPVSKGGSSTERNIRLLCTKCNRRKKDKIL
jgi:hypothetical protein